MANGYFYMTTEGSKKGPISEEILKQLLASGLIQAETQIWRDPEIGWQQISSFPEFDNFRNTPLLPTPPLLSTTVDTPHQKQKVRISYDGPTDQVEADWYYRMPDGSKKGPLQENLLKQLFSDGFIPGNTLVCRRNEDSWKEIFKIPNFTNSFVKPTAPSFQITKQHASIFSKKYIKVSAIIFSAICLAWLLLPIGINLAERLYDPIYAQVDDKLQQIYDEVNHRTGNTYNFKYLGRYWHGANYQWRVYLFRVTMGNKKDYGNQLTTKLVFVFTYLDKNTNKWKYYGEKFYSWPMIAHPVDIPDELVETIKPEDKLIFDEKEKFIQKVLTEPRVGVSSEELVPIK